MRMGLIGILKLIFVVIVGVFLVKVASAWTKKKFPNPVTNTVDGVIQAV